MFRIDAGERPKRLELEERPRRDGEPRVHVHADDLPQDGAAAAVEGLFHVQAFFAAFYIGSWHSSAAERQKSRYRLSETESTGRRYTARVAVADILALPLVLVGPGRAGKALARSWMRAGGRLALVVARTRPARRAPDASSRRAAPPPPGCRSAATCSSLAVPDDRIAAVARDLARRTSCRFAFHLSGALPAALLAPLARRGAAVGSLHPLRAFPAHDEGTPETAPDGRALSSPSRAIPRRSKPAERLAAALGATGRRIDTASKPLYHAAATLAAGGTMALLSVAVRAAVRAGLPEPEARAGARKARRRGGGGDREPSLPAGLHGSDRAARCADRPRAPRRGSRACRNSWSSTGCSRERSSRPCPGRGGERRFERRSASEGARARRTLERRPARRSRRGRARPRC